MTIPPLRTAVRVVALDGDGRVLLLRYEENGGFWATPGGALNGTEDHLTALRREMCEELGTDGDGVRVDGPVAERTKEFPFQGAIIRQVERYYLARLSARDVDVARATQPDTIQEYRWWTVGELRATRETVYPADLGDLVTEIVTSGVPERPVVLR
ncbi:NUDIX hydrolase [Herbidospora yilanensis]|uniref:NUDIX hydrolase n=1 Tax=Herbidospora yilanensis TaxID=354426 RepID=UPI0007C6C9EF|nr:NUDIX domain-containing protein [Herbidospora yilanensis]